LLQGWLDIGAMVILSLLYFIWAGRTLLSFCLLTCTFISLFGSGSGRTQQLFQPCKQALLVGGHSPFFARTKIISLANGRYIQGLSLNLIGSMQGRFKHWWFKTPSVILVEV
jgi:hypothetical protein